MKLEVVNNNLVLIHLGAKVFRVVTDDNTAIELANRLTNWDEMFKREDAANEPTQEIEIKKGA